MKRACLLALLIGLNAPLRAQMQRPLSPNDQRARDIFEQLININTTGSSGSTTVAANAMAKRLLDAGFPAADVQVIGPPDSKNHNLVARLRGTGTQKPILLLAHIDVVEAKRADWSVDPFTLLEKDGFFYGRGTLDVKDGAAILVATLARLKQEGYRPNRDLILALTTGEEGGSDYNGVEWLLANHRDLIEAAYVINMDAGDPVILNGKRAFRSVQAAEKVYVTFKLEVHNPMRSRGRRSPNGRKCSRDRWRRIWPRSLSRRRTPPRSGGSRTRAPCTTRSCARPALRRSSPAGTRKTRCRSPQARRSIVACCRERRRTTCSAH